MGAEPGACRRSGGQVDIGEADVLQERVVRIAPAVQAVGGLPESHAAARASHLVTSLSVAA